MRQQLDALTVWYASLQPREKLLVMLTSAVMVVTLFYLLIWEPVYQGLEQEQQKYETHRNVLAWMQTASIEAKTLKQTGARPATNTNQPVSLVVEQSAASAGLKKYLGKLESSGKEGARVTIDTASFDQILIWLNTLQQKHGIIVTSASIERTDKPGTVSARLSFNRS